MFAAEPRSAKVCGPDSLQNFAARLEHRLVFRANKTSIVVNKVDVARFLLDTGKNLSNGLSSVRSTVMEIDPVLCNTVSRRTTIPPSRVSRSATARPMTLAARPMTQVLPVKRAFSALIWSPTLCLSANSRPHSHHRKGVQFAECNVSEVAPASLTPKPHPSVLPPYQPLIFRSVPRFPTAADAPPREAGFLSG